mgnify:CR=1 FL=1|jgi:fructose transport system substrate-binding protein
MQNFFTRRTITTVALVGVSALLLVAGPTSQATAAKKKVGVSLILKNLTNPFFIAMTKGAKAQAKKNNVSLSVAAGKDETDDAAQITAIENAISKKDAGILITAISPGVYSAITKARKAGLFVIALDTPTDPATIVDITYATDNCLAGELIGRWAASKMDGKKAVIALLDIFDDKNVTTDYCRDNGFLKGLGVPLGNPKLLGDEPKTGKYTGGKGGDYEIVGNVATLGAEEGGRTGMEILLAKNPKINLVYTLNEPAAAGANAALKAAGVEAVIVSVDGGRAGVENVKAGVIGATSQQYPLLMAKKGVKAIAKLIRSGVKPAVTPGLDFYNTGVILITDDPQPGVPSKSVSYGLKNAWG